MSSSTKYSLRPKLYPLFTIQPQSKARRMRAPAARHSNDTCSVIYIINSVSRRSLISPLSIHYRQETEHYLLHQAALLPVHCHEKDC